MLFAPKILYLLAAMFALSAFAQSAKETADPVKAVDTEKTIDLEWQERRALLRASLKSQAETTPVAQPIAQATRKMSDQERADLRQQLRQQPRQQ